MNLETKRLFIRPIKTEDFFLIRKFASFEIRHYNLLKLYTKI
jgi:hypothetical protein